MSHRARTLVLLFLLLFAVAARTAAADPPAPLNSGLFALPGSCDQPPSAASAGMACADQWLGDFPFSNPAAPRGRGVMLSPAMVRMNRQDLRAGNRNFDEQAAFFDAAGAALAIPYVPMWLYVQQPVLRFEDFAFNRGSFQDPAQQPAVVTGQADMRETRAGATLSFGMPGLRSLRMGAGVEWTRREDRYATEEESGAPDQGVRQLEFSGDGIGGTLGLRYQSADSGARAWTVGGGVRYVPELKLEGSQQLDLLSGASETQLSATREAGWEGGLSAAYHATRAFRLVASMSGRSEQRWDGLDLTGGSAVAMRLGLEFRDPLEPWAFRLGIGQEQQRGVPEPRAGSIGIGFGYDWEGILLDVGVLHRGVERTGRPRSYDDRVVGSITVQF